MDKYFCGLDLHRESVVGCVMDFEGVVVREHEFPFSKDAFACFFSGLPSSDLSVAIEACGMWRGAYNLLSELGYKVKLASPKKTHDIACNKKTDKVDACILADLLRSNYLPEVYIPGPGVLEMRDLARHKGNLTRLRVCVQLKIKGYLLRDGVKYGKKLWVGDSLSVVASEHENVRNLANVYEGIKKEEKEVLKRIKNTAGNMRLANLLMSMTGIAEYSALIILAEIGDIKRFRSPKELVSYAGLCPGIYQSGEREHGVRNQAVNKNLKWILYECSGRASMLDPMFRSYYQKIKQKKGFKTARRATARKMLIIMWHMLTKEETYNPSGSFMEKGKGTPCA
jgi:transposase